ncbi:MAG TPA: peptidylprolyl isomerase [Novosphingobium sp.]|nr:peptidylprolyl isomerase [Novosphingobium sp.]
MATWLREPLVHFMIAGALVFVALSGRPADPGERRIVVSETLVTRLATGWTETYRRPPSADELDGLIRDYVKSEVYYREALRLGLDRDDEVVKRRMRSKLESVGTADAEAREPSDAELQALLDRDPARYTTDPRYDFQQIYLGADTAASRVAAGHVLARLRSGAAPTAVGQPIALPGSLRDNSASDVAELFGDEFAAGLRGVPVGQWNGPVASGLGLHLVKVERVAAPAAPKLAAVRQRVENDWRSATIRKADDEGYRKLLDGYDVVIEQPR